MNRPVLPVAAGPAARPAWGYGGDRGQSLIVVVLVFPIVVLLCLGLVDFGRTYYSDYMVGVAVEQGVKAAATDKSRDDAVKEAVRKAAEPLVIGDANISVDPPLPSERVPGVAVTVRASYSFAPMTPFVGPMLPAGQVTVSRSASRLIY